MFNTVFHSFVVIDYILSSLTRFKFINNCAQIWPMWDKGHILAISSRMRLGNFKNMPVKTLTVSTLGSLGGKFCPRVSKVNALLSERNIQATVKYFHKLDNISYLICFIILSKKVLMVWKTVIYGWRTSNFRCHSGSRWCKVQMESHHRHFHFRKWKNSKGIWSNLGRPKVTFL